MERLEQTITTVEIAEIMEVSHKEILRKLEGASDRKGYIQIFAENQMALSDYFLESTYADSSGKENKCYSVTKIGCDFLANKFTGEKGILFTAKYVKRFHEMEDTIKTEILSSLSPELQAIFAHDKKLQVIVAYIETQENKISEVNNDKSIRKHDSSKSKRIYEAHIPFNTVSNITSLHSSLMRKTAVKTVNPSRHSPFQLL